MLKTYLLSLGSVFLVSACFYDWNKDIELLEKEDIVCAPNAVLEKRRWGGFGMTGLVKECKVMHGPFIAADEGYVQIRGQYDNGVPDGIWNFYDEDGNVVTSIDYGSEKNHMP